MMKSLKKTPRVAPLRPNLVFDANEQLFVAQFDTIDQDRLKWFRVIYEGPKSILIEMMKEHLEAQKQMMLFEEAIRV